MDSMSCPVSASKNLIRHFKIKVLLIDDQEIISQAVQSMIEGAENIEFAFCQDPSKAIETAEEFMPTVILQDLVMPEIDGLMLVRYFRANPTTRYIPLVVLSSKEEPKVKAEAFSAGANDYLVKLPDREELLARIKYHSNAYIRLLERNEAYHKLELSQRQLRNELHEAAQYVTSLLPLPLDEEIQTYWRFIPSRELGGDAFGYHWIDENHFSIYLLDVCGHGVGAALLSISVINVIRNQTLAKANMLDPASVMYALNEAFPMEKNNQMFFTMWYGVFNKQTRNLTYCSGGHPPAILFSGDTPQSVEMSLLKTPGFLVGGDENAQFSNSQTYIGKYNQLFVFSDGVFEIRDKDGKMMTFDQFAPLVEKACEFSGEELDQIVLKTQEYIGKVPYEDDFSILEVIFN